MAKKSPRSAGPKTEKAVMPKKDLYTGGQTVPIPPWPPREVKPDESKGK